MYCEQEVNGRRDLTLMAELACGDQAALATLYERYSGTVLAIALRILHNREEAEEVTIEVFWELWDRRDRFNIQRSSVRAYIFLLTRSRALDRRRSKASRSKRCFLSDNLNMRSVSNHDSDSGQNAPDAQIALREMQMEIRAAITDLCEAERMVVELAFFEGLTHREIAERLSKPLGTIKTQIRKALLRLKRIFISFEGMSH